MTEQKSQTVFWGIPIAKPGWQDFMVSMGFALLVAFMIYGIGLFFGKPDLETALSMIPFLFAGAACVEFGVRVSTHPFKATVIITVVGVVLFIGSAMIKEMVLRV